MPVETVKEIQKAQLELFGENEDGLLKVRLEADFEEVRYPAMFDSWTGHQAHLLPTDFAR